VRLHYEVSERNDAPNLVLVNSLGSNLHMWDKVLPALEGKYLVLRSDIRGHGQSEASGKAFAIEDLGRDVLKLMDEVGARRSSFCGVSLGGLVSLWIAIHAPDRVDKLILANTAARIGSEEMWKQRIEAVRTMGMEALSAAMIERWFTPAYRNKHPKDVEKIRAMIGATDPEGYMECCAALHDADLRAKAAEVKAATLVITGTHDLATPPALGRALHAAIEHSSYLELDASHMAAWECADEFAAAVVQHLAATKVAHG
jgi:3-oxoadipate enol-lactonase